MPADLSVLARRLATVGTVARRSMILAGILMAVGTVGTAVTIVDNREAMRRQAREARPARPARP